LLVSEVKVLNGHWESLCMALWRARMAARAR
jgi:hypothetical protein